MYTAKIISKNEDASRDSVIVRVHITNDTTNLIKDYEFNKDATKEAIEERVNQELVRIEELKRQATELEIGEELNLTQPE